MEINKDMNITNLFILLSFALLLSACDTTPKLPDPCTLVTKEYIEDLLYEPIEPCGPIEGLGNAIAACAYPLPMRGRNIQLEIHLLPPLPSRDQMQVQQLAAQWVAEQGYKPDFDVIPGDYPMVWFPGKIARYPSALLVPFDKTTLVIRRLQRDNAKSLAFAIMQQNGWK